MKLVLCTLFDKNYLDKGLVLHGSLEKVCDNYELYILPMDEKCAEVLLDLRLSNVVVVPYSEFEDNELRFVKKERSRAEFCWSCTAKLIQYILDNYNTPQCTYIDADMYFYHNPEVLLQEMITDNKSVQILRHNFPRKERKLNEKLYGEFCVEFNTFLSTEEARIVLNVWSDDCIRDCSYGKSNEVMGDQKYLCDWPTKYDCINISKNQGAGVAPWNINKFLIKKENSEYIIIDKESKVKYPLIFFHFQNLLFRTENEVYCCLVRKNEYCFVKTIYEEYLNQIMNAKKILLEKYGISSLIKIHPADENIKSKTRRDEIKELSSKCLIEVLNKLFEYIHRKFINLSSRIMDRELVIYVGEMPK